MSEVTTRVTSKAYAKGLEIFKVLTIPAVQHILSVMENNRDAGARDMVTANYSYNTILKYVRSLVRMGLVRRDRLGSDVTYRLSYDRFDKINAAAACL